MFDEGLAHKHNLSLIKITPQPLRFANGKIGAHVTYITRIDIDISGRQETIWACVMTKFAVSLLCCESINRVRR